MESLTRQTRQKQAVLQALAGSGLSLAPAEILALAREQVPTLNLSTVYRQLRALHEEAQVVRVDLPGQAARFEALCLGPQATSHAAGARAKGEHGQHTEQHHDHHHHHFHCTACDRVFPIHGCPQGIERLAPQGFRIQQHELTLRGLCRDCVGAT
jgi:Fur family transcriptional regulator, ferric uptake regulator